ncbi:hypothetical protein B7463_g12349, partial [Scytalidium lignicola]
MADPLSLVASLIAVAQVSGSIISLCYYYRRGVQGAQKDIAQILRNVIEQLIPLLDRDDVGSEVMLEWLGAPDPSVRHNDFYKKRAKDTGLWQLNRSAFEAWCDARMSSFWLHGIPGCGKSVLSSVVIEHIKYRNGLGNDAALAYFYFDFSNEAISKSEVMLRSLVSQLAAWKGKPPKALAQCAIRYFRKTYCGDGLAVYRDGIAQPPVQDLVKILRGIAEEYDDTYLVVDALDECMDQGELLGILNDILAAQVDGLRIFLASRHTVDIAAVLDSKVVHTVEASSEDVGRDIVNFVQAQLSVPKLRKWPASLRNEIQDSLVSGAGGMFRWVDCQLGILGKCVTIKDVRKALKALLKSLSETYALTLDRIDEHHSEYAIKVLMWLAISPKPLEIREAADILAVNFESEGGPVYDEDLRVLDPTEIPTMCTSLVATATTCLRTLNGDLEKTIELHLAHYTVREYLLSEAFFSRLRHTIRCANKPQVHAFVAKTSLAYLLSMSETLTDELRKDRPLSRQAAEFWVYHYLESQKETSLESLVLQLFRDNGQTETYRNWCKLSDPSKPWRGPDLRRSWFPAPLYYASFEGLEPLVLALLKAGADPNTAGEIHKTCLQAAACNGHFSIVCALLEAGADPNGGELLLKHGADPNKTSYADATALTIAARRNHIEVVRQLLNGGADPNRYHPKPTDVNPLEAASSRGYKDCVALMLPKASQETALGGLEKAYRAGVDRDMLKIFIEFVPDGVLNYAAALGYEDLVAELLDRGAKPETKVNLGYRRHDAQASALVEACANGHLAIAKQLIDKGADVNIESSKSFADSYALASAARKGNAEVVKLLLTHGANVSASGRYGPALQIAAYEGHKEIVQILIEHGASLEDGTGSYGGPVQAAVPGDHVDILQLILKAGVDPNMMAGSCRISHGRMRLSGSPIQAAVACSNIHMVDFLLEHGANPNLCSNRRLLEGIGTPLSTAARDGNLDLVNRLLDAGADVNQPDQTSGSGPALFWAVEGGSLRVVSRLLDAGADPNAPWRTSIRSQATILAEACMRENTLVIEALLKAGADIHQYSGFRENNEPPIHTAARCGNVDVIRVLIKHGANVNEQSQGGWTALHKAARGSRHDILRVLLLESKADPSLPLENGSLPIHSAASWNSPECLELLVQAGSDINARNKTGRTPLHWAADIGAPRAVEWLLQNGADDRVEEHGTNMTARDYAELKMLVAESWAKSNKTEVLEMFDRHANKAAGSLNADC